MSELENRLLTWTHSRPCVWWRYIDDVFAIWQHGQEALDIFLEQINNFHPTIKFTSEHSTKSVAFLDTTVILEGNVIHTDLHTKPTDTHQYLSPNSCHPRHCTLSIPYSQGLRLRRICSRDSDFKHRAQDLKEHLLSRGYKESMIDLQIQIAAIVPRQVALQCHARSTLGRTPLVITYHPSLNNLPAVLTKHFPILHTSKKLNNALPNPPMVAFRRPRNLKDLLVHARISTPSPSLPAGNSPCKGKNCKCCAEIVTCNKFSSTTTSRTYNIRSEMTCKSSNLVYLITCKRCNLQYVGETKQPLHFRMNGHRSDIRTKKNDKPVAAHFCQPDHHTKDVQVRGIEKIHHGGTLRGGVSYCETARPSCCAGPTQ